MKNSNQSARLKCHAGTGNWRHYLRSSAAVLVYSLLVSSSAMASNNAFMDCILKEMPGVESDYAAGQIFVACRQQHDPTGPTDKRQGWFDYKSGAECVAKKGKATRSQLGAGYIGMACRALYEPANPFADPNFGKERSCADIPHPPGFDPCTAVPVR